MVAARQATLLTSMCLVGFRVPSSEVLAVMCWDPGLVPWGSRRELGCGVLSEHTLRSRGLAF